MINRDLDTLFGALRTALNAESWDWLQEANYPLARALATEIAHGATPADIRHYVMAHTGRPALASRCYQAAEYLQAQEATARTG